MDPINRSVIARLPRYYHFVRDSIVANGAEIVSSWQLAQILGSDDTLVRHDMAAIGVKGQPRVGFRCDEIISRIREVLGFDVQTPAVLVGAGRLGGAIVSYPGFAEYGLKIAGVFDANDDIIGTMVGGLEVQPFTEAADVIREQSIELAILTVSAESAQKVATAMIEAGIIALWNFTPGHIETPPEIKIRHELLSVGFTELSYYLQMTRVNGS